MEENKISQTTPQMQGPPENLSTKDKNAAICVPVDPEYKFTTAKFMKIHAHAQVLRSAMG